MARRPGQSRSKKPAPSKRPRPPASRSRRDDQPGSHPRSKSARPEKLAGGRGRPAGSQAKARRGIIEVPQTSPSDDAFEPVERSGEASIGHFPTDGAGWDVDRADATNADATHSESAEEDLVDQSDDDSSDSIQARQRVRLQRVLADAGVAARRHAESLIEQGRVTVNSQVVRELPCFVDPHFDRIHVDGRPIPKPARHVYVMFHKPERVLVTDADEPGMDRKTLRDFVRHPAAPRLFAIGRLDFQTTGIVLMTNDGELANRVSHPRANLAKTYHVVVKGAPTPQNMKVFTRAATMGDRALAKVDPRAAMKVRSRPRTPLEVRVITSDAAKSFLEVTTRDERNLDIRGACLAAGLPVKKITRVSYGPVRLTALPLGNWRELTRPEVNALKKAARLGKEGRASPPPSNPGVDFSNIPPERFADPDGEQPMSGPSRGADRPSSPKVLPKASPNAPVFKTKPAKPRPVQEKPSRPEPRESQPSKFRPRVIS